MGTFVATPRVCAGPYHIFLHRQAQRPSTGRRLLSPLRWTLGNLFGVLAFGLAMFAGPFINSLRSYRCTRSFDLPPFPLVRISEQVKKLVTYWCGFQAKTPSGWFAYAQPRGGGQSAGKKNSIIAEETVEREAEVADGGASGQSKKKFSSYGKFM